jgi:hypothetical protein
MMTGNDFPQNCTKGLPGRWQWQQLRTVWNLCGTARSGFSKLTGRIGETVAGTFRTAKAEDAVRTAGFLILVTVLYISLREPFTPTDTGVQSTIRTTIIDEAHHKLGHMGVEVQYMYILLGSEKQKREQHK